jgi:hypothetical protein
MLHRACALRDFYPFWKTRNVRSRAGKLLLLDLADEDTVQIFFDDNVGHGAAHIVDARDARTGASLPFQVPFYPGGSLVYMGTVCYFIFSASAWRSFCFNSMQQLPPHASAAQGLSWELCDCPISDQWKPAL